MSQLKAWEQMDSLCILQLGSAPPHPAKASSQSCTHLSECQLQSLVCLARLEHGDYHQKMVHIKKEFIIPDMPRSGMSPSVSCLFVLA